MPSLNSPHPGPGGAVELRGKPGILLGGGMVEIARRGSSWAGPNAALGAEVSVGGNEGSKSPVGLHSPALCSPAVGVPYAGV